MSENITGYDKGEIPQVKNVNLDKMNLEDKFKNLLNQKVTLQNDSHRAFQKNRNRDQ